MFNFDSNLKMKIVVVALAVAVLPACTFVSSQSVYEGIRSAEKTKTTGTTQNPEALPNYDRYEKEREVLKK